MRSVLNFSVFFSPFEIGKSSKHRKTTNPQPLSPENPNYEDDFEDYPGEGFQDEDDMSNNQMEILELEMRARAIKAMIKAQVQTSFLCIFLFNVEMFYQKL